MKNNLHFINYVVSKNEDSEICYRTCFDDNNVFTEFRKFKEEEFKNKIENNTLIDCVIIRCSSKKVRFSINGLNGHDYRERK